MVQAAVEGIVDFRQAKLYDRRWSQYVQLMIDGLARRNRRELRGHLFHQALSMLSSPRLDSSQAGDIQDHVADLYTDIKATYFPEAKKEQVQREKQLIRKDIQGWESRFGELSKEETKQRLSSFVRAMEELRRRTADDHQKAAQGSMGYLAKELGIKDPGSTSRRRK